MYVRALRGKKKVLGAEHTSTLDTVVNLGATYAIRGKISEAEEMYERALRGEEHPSKLNAVTNLGNLYFNQGKVVEAEDMYLRALCGSEEAWGAEHMSTLTIIYNLGALYTDQDKKVEAEEIYIRALRGYEKARGLRYPLTLKTMNLLGDLYLRQGKTEEAEMLLLSMIKRTLEADGTWPRSFDFPLHRLLSNYRQRAHWSFAFCSGKLPREFAPFISSRCQPAALWDRVLGLRGFFIKPSDQCLYLIGGILLAIGDESDAIHAFQHCKSILLKGIERDGCVRVMPADEDHHSCNSCEFRDFCRRCWLRCHADDDQETSQAIAQRSSHRFCEVPGVKQTEVEDLEVARQAAKRWLHDLFDRGPTFGNRVDLSLLTIGHEMLVPL
jgi:tetratricopeptide (TPR) repeat protein